MDEARALARSILRDRYPDAIVGILGESALGDLITSTSDLDLVVISSDATAPRWEGFRSGSWPVEAFVASRTDWDRQIAQERRERCPVVLRISLEGVPLEVSKKSDELQQRAREVFDAGPPPIGAAEAQLARRLITDLWDDLESAPSNQERPFVVEAIFRQTAELLLLGRRRWIGRGKWLARALDENDEGQAERFSDALAAAHGGEIRPLLELAEAALSEVGGRVEGDWTLPAGPSP